MACFLVPVAEAVVTTIGAKVIEKKEGAAEQQASQAVAHIPFSRKLKWLNNMLWGGSALLAFEHVWHGEVTPWFPFLTNAATPEQASEVELVAEATGTSKDFRDAVFAAIEATMGESQLPRIVGIAIIASAILAASGVIVVKNVCRRRKNG